MIQEHFCNYENSLGLKALGFDEVSLLAFNESKLIVHRMVTTNGIDCYASKDKWDTNLSCPLLSQAIQWIQGVNELAIEIKWDDDLRGWSYYLYDTTKKNVQLARNWAYETWNQCAQDAITKAIELIKNETT